MSKMPWFRLYHRIIDDEKIRMLAFEDRWHFVAICCLKASGLLDEPDEKKRDRRIAVKLGIQLRELDEIKRRLFEEDLVDENLNPIAWDDLQYRSDNSTDRVRRYREKLKKNNDETKRNVSVTAQDTDTDTDTDTSSLRSEVARERVPSRFDDFWSLYPNKVGKADARKKFDKALKAVSFDKLMAGLSRYVAKTDDRPWCNPSTWLHQERWSDAPAQPSTAPRRQPRGADHFMISAMEDLKNEQFRNGQGEGNFSDDVPGFPFLLEHNRG